MIDGKQLSETIKTGTDAELDAFAMAQLDLDGNGVIEWRIDNYVLLRQLAYPPMADYLDAIVKEDQGQVDAYRATCLAVKARFQKE